MGSQPVVRWERQSGGPPVGAEDPGRPRAMLGAGSGAAVVLDALLDSGADGTSPGAGTVPAVAGPWAVVVWRPLGAQLVAATDPFGLLPLYWAEHGGRLVVGVSAREVARAVGGPLTPAPAAAAAHLLGRPPAADASFFAGVRRLPAGCRLIAGARELLVQPYLEPEPPTVRTRPLEEVLAEIVERLLETVRGHADRRVGVALSGGLDSAAVAVARARAFPGRTVALTWAAPELAAADEWAATRRLAGRLDMTFHAVRGDRRWPLSGGEAALAGGDGPAQVALPEVWDALLAAARELGVEVLLTGAGGDQLFRTGSYFVLFEAFFAGRWRYLAREVAALRRSDRGRVGRLLRPFVVALLPRRRPRWRSPPWVCRELVAAAPRSAEPFSWLPHPLRRLRREALEPARLVAPLHDLAARAETAGIEIAHPLLDRRIVALALELAGHDLVDRGREKWPLRRLLAGWLPDEPVGEHSGRSAAPLVHRGLRERGRDVAWSLLTSMQAAERGWVDEGRLQAAYRRYLAGDDDLSFWRAMTLEAWLRRSFGGAR